MTKRRFYLFPALCCLLLSSCSDFFRDDFQLDAPSEAKIKISFPGLVAFEITQTVLPDRQGITNEVSNTFLIANEQNQPINKLKFGINIFDSADRFEKNLLVSYVDSIRQPMTAFGRTGEKIFNKSFDLAIAEEMIDIFILEQDVLDTHPFGGIYVGEAFYYAKADTTPINIPFVYGAVDYKGDLLLRASGNQVADYNISGRLSSSGQFVGQSNSSAANSPIENLRNKSNTNILLQNGRLGMTFVPVAGNGSSLDSIALVLNRN